MKFNHSVVGGTFDHLHKGHMALLKVAMRQSKKLTIGLTSPSFVSDKFLKDLIEPFAIRKKHLKQFLGAYPANIVSISNPIGPAGAEKKYTTIFVSQETEAMARKINRIRQKNGLPSLKIVIVDPVKTTSGQWLSSRNIRQGLVSAKGLSYQDLFLPKKLNLPKEQRRHFKNPLSKLVAGDPQKLHLASKKVVRLIEKKSPFMTIAVGDIAVMSLINQDLAPDLSIIDLKTRRGVFAKSPQELGLKHQPDYSALNPAGTITPSLVKAILKGLKKLYSSPQLKLSLLVKGEEDLATLPAVLLAPLTSVVIYGQPDKGLVYVEINEAIKAKAVGLINKFI